MNRKEVAAIVAYVSQLQPAQRFDDYTALAWFDVLGDVDATVEQATKACAAVAKRERWIAPSDIREELLTILREANPPPRAAILQAPPSPREDRIERNARGAALAKAAVKPFPSATREDAPDIPENLKRARAAAVEHRAGQARRDNALKLGAAGGQVLSQINQARRNNR